MLPLLKLALQKHTSYNSFKWEGILWIYQPCTHNFWRHIVWYHNTNYTLHLKVVQNRRQYGLINKIKSDSNGIFPLCNLLLENVFSTEIKLFSFIMTLDIYSAEYSVNELITCLHASKPFDWLSLYIFPQRVWILVILIKTLLMLFLCILAGIVSIFIFKVHD